MKKHFKTILTVLCIVLIAVAVIKTVTVSVKLHKYFELTDALYEKDTSIFINELPVFTPGEVLSVTVKKSSGNWNINGKSYAVQKNAFSLNYDPTVNWRVDLSKLKPCGESGDIELYSQTGEATNDVIVAKAEDELVLLAFGNILSVIDKAVEDFHTTEDIPELEKIWQDHLSGAFNIKYLLIDDGTGMFSVELTLKNHPELLYKFSCFDYDGNYYSRLPFDETSNGYYDFWERVKAGLKKIRYTDF